MNARIWTAACGAIVCGAVAGVLAQPLPQDPSQQTQSAAKTITVTGCVQRAQQQPTGTTGTAAGAATADMTKFILTNAALATNATATGTSGTTTPPATAIASEYRLEGTDATLTAHVGEKVQITGSIQQPSPTEQKPTASAANAPKLKVDSVKMLASTCTGK